MKINRLARAAIVGLVASDGHAHDGDARSKALQERAVPGVAAGQLPAGAAVSELQEIKRWSQATNSGDLAELQGIGELTPVVSQSSIKLPAAPDVGVLTRRGCSPGRPRC